MENTIVEASAPGKFILFGEHAVIYGEPAIALATNLRTTVKIGYSRTGNHLVNGQSIKEYFNRYTAEVINRHWNGAPLDILTKTKIPNASGLGSSAAITTAMTCALLGLKGITDEKEIARNAFKVEYHVQGKASPTDTSASSHGNGILVTRKKKNNHLWKLTKGEESWNIGHVDVSKMTMVIGKTNIGSRTAPQVAKVKRFVDSNSFARDVIKDIGKLTKEGLEYLRNGNKKELGELMKKNHNMLAVLGINTPELQTMVDAVESYSYGAKLTGAGGGGSIIALTDQPKEAANAIWRAGGNPYIIATTTHGVKIQTKPLSKQ